MEQQKKKLREKIMDERIFGSIVDKAFSDADLNKNGFIDKKELAFEEEKSPEQAPAPS